MSGKKREGKPGKRNRQNEQKNSKIPPATAVTPEQGQPTVKAGDSHSQHESKLPESNWITWIKGWRKWRLAGSAVAIATVIAAWAAVEMRNSAKDQLVLNKLEQSPQLTFDNPYVAPLVIGEYLHGTATIRNTGKLSATVVVRKIASAPGIIVRLSTITPHALHSEVDCYFDYKELLDELTIEDRFLTTHYIMLPGESQRFGWQSAQLLTREHVAKFNGRGVGFAIVAYAKYLDPLNESHSISSCFLYGLDFGMAIKLPQHDRTEKDSEKPFPTRPDVSWTKSPDGPVPEQPAK